MGPESGRDGSPPRGPGRAARDGRVLLPWQLVRVDGPSMVPTLRSGDRLLVRRGGAVAPGDVVLARFPDLPTTLVVKRLTGWDGPGGDGSGGDGTGGAVLASDNAAAGGDSRTHGAGEVLGRVVLLWRGRRPHRVPPAPDLGGWPDHPDLDTL